MDPGDEDDGEQKCAEADARLLRYQPYETLAPMSILTANYCYPFGRPLRVEHLDHDLGDEDRRWSGWVGARRVWGRCNPIRSNPPRPSR